jgi:hypothetical protein
MMRSLRLALAIAIALPLGCDRLPARFAAAPPVTDAHDDAPVAQPKPLDPLDAVYMTEAYLRRPLVEAFEPERVPDARDVNAVDEVPRSSWFSPTPGDPSPLGSHGAPVPPLAAQAADLVDDALPVRDARGVSYLLVRDPPDRPEMATGAAMVASRLLRALGWITADTTLADVARKDVVAMAPAAGQPTTAQAAAIGAFFAPPKGAPSDRLRVAAVEWPGGVDLGPTPTLGARKDDPNDGVAHTDRRTLRALGTVGAWLRLRRFGPSTLRDVYVGEPGKGHVVHALVRLDAALGAGSVVRPQDPNEADPVDYDPLRDLATLGLAKPADAPTQTRFPALGELDARVLPRDARPSPPLDPVDRALPADAYWAAKRIAALSAEAITSAIAAARYSAPFVSAELARLLEARRAAVVARAMAAVTPCEVDRVEGARLVLRDEALVRRAADAASTRYAVALLDDHDRPLGPAAVARPEGGRFVVDLGPAIAARATYFLVGVVAVRADHASPRRFEAHFVATAGAPRLVGVRH